MSLTRTILSTASLLTNDHDGKMSATFGDNLMPLSQCNASETGNTAAAAIQQTNLVRQVGNTNAIEIWGRGQTL